ncbi:hypothetical protein DPMN_060001 [Dreissena polymorpha]|uniref:Uncharacterized protein n=1 Tax=Dreissena polymorpha TaxID=45954 RepID=A0A9D4C4T3_DREPO|nr:hypothetical protein DPMN_060001 [Dreissena polymorpha]
MMYFQLASFQKKRKKKRSSSENASGGAVRSDALSESAEGYLSPEEVLNLCIKNY